MFIKVLIPLGILVILFVWWRRGSVERGARKRDAIVLARLDDLAERLEAQSPIAPSEVASVAALPENRPLLYQLLSHYGKAALFPAPLLTPASQGEGILAYWLMHPNELQGAPAAIEHVETIAASVAGRSGDFLVYKYRMPSGHWAGTDWLLGLAGPFLPSEEPYLGIAGGFSRVNDRFGQVTPKALIDWYTGILESKFEGV